MDDPNPSEEPLEVEDPQLAGEPQGPWQLSHARFAVSVERATALMGFKQTTSVSGVGFEKVETSISGLDVGFLGSGGVVQSPSSVPRIAFDGVLPHRFSLGGAISYMSTSATVTSDDGKDTELGEAHVFLLAPRIGVLLQASDSVAFWLKTGLLRASVSTDRPSTGIGGSSSSVSETVTTWAWTLEPQLVLLAAPHVGITISPHAEIGFAGGYESDDSLFDSENVEVTQSAWGLSGGLMALF